MTLDQIKAAVLAGKVVHWRTPRYTVICDLLGSFLIAYGHGTTEANYIGLTWLDGVTLNGKESEFYVIAA